MLATRAPFTGAIPDVPPRSAALALTVSPEGGWTWFNAPNAIYHEGKTFIGYISGDGHPMAVQYDHATEIVSTPVRLYPSGVFEVDDHDDAALLRRSSDGRILAYYSVHFGDDQYVNVSTNPDDVTAWDGPVNIGAAIGANITTYMCPIEMPDGSIRVFFRDHYDGVNAEWAYADSANGETFSGHTSLVRLTYARPIRAGARIHFVASGYAPEEQFGIWHFYWEGGSYYHSDGTLISASLPLTKDDITEVYDGSTTRAWLWDIAVDGAAPVIAFATFPGNDGIEHRYQYARWTGSAWDVNEVADAGGSITASPPDPEAFYSGGVAIDRTNPNIVYYSSNAAGNRDMFRAVTSDGGSTWRTLALTDDATKDFRPKAVAGPALPLRVLWLSGTYGSFIDWAAGLAGGY